MLSAPIIANGTDSAFYVLAAKPANTALAPVAMPVRETNPWAHAPDAANQEIAAIRPGKVATDVEVEFWEQVLKSASYLVKTIKNIFLPSQKWL